MLPNVVFYILAGFLVFFGAWRLIYSARGGAGRKRYHMGFGLVWVLAGLVLLAMQLGLLPTPRIGK